MPAVETVTVLITDLVGSTGLGVARRPGRRRRPAPRALRPPARGDRRPPAARRSRAPATGSWSSSAARRPRSPAPWRSSSGWSGATARRAEPLAIRVGVALGDATCEDGDYFGMPVIEAARLCDQAAGGQILATELVRLIGGRDGHRVLAGRRAELRGLPQPVRRLRGRLGAAAGVARRAAAAAAAAAPCPPAAYVGREPERRRPRASAGQAVRGGRRQALLVAGEPGIGKTRFATHAALELARPTARRCCSATARRRSARPTRPGSRRSATSSSTRRPTRWPLHVERHGGELARLVPALGRRVPDAPAPTQTDPETER